MRSGNLDFRTTSLIFKLGNYIGATWARQSKGLKSVTDDVGSTSSSFTAYIRFSNVESFDTSQRFFGYPLRCLSTAVEGEESMKVFLSRRFPAGAGRLSDGLV